MTQLAKSDASPAEPAEVPDAAEAVATSPDPEAEARREAALGLIRKFGDPSLRTRALPVQQFDAGLRSEVERMATIMGNAMGVGLAATQLAIAHRLLVYRVGEDAPLVALVNPKREWHSAEEEVGEEGCLSLPGVVVDLERPVYMRVRARDVDGSDLLVEASGLEARVIQHEMDHLDGVLIVDHASPEQRREALAILRGERPPLRASTLSAIG